MGGRGSQRESEQPRLWWISSKAKQWLLLFCTSRFLLTGLVSQPIISLHLRHGPFNNVHGILMLHIVVLLNPAV
jgi:hypothetical protein